MITSLPEEGASRCVSFVLSNTVIISLPEEGAGHCDSFVLSNTVIISLPEEGAGRYVGRLLICPRFRSLINTFAAKPLEKTIYQCQECLIDLIFLYLFYQ